MTRELYMFDAYFMPKELPDYRTAAELGGVPAEGWGVFKSGLPDTLLLAIWENRGDAQAHADELTTGDPNCQSADPVSPDRVSYFVDQVALVALKTVQAAYRRQGASHGS